MKTRYMRTRATAHRLACVFRSHLSKKKNKKMAVGIFLYLDEKQFVNMKIFDIGTLLLQRQRWC